MDEKCPIAAIASNVKITKYREIIKCIFHRLIQFPDVTVSLMSTLHQHSTNERESLMP